MTSILLWISGLSFLAFFIINMFYELLFIKSTLIKSIKRSIILGLITSVISPFLIHVLFGVEMTALFLTTFVTVVIGGTIYYLNTLEEK